MFANEKFLTTSVNCFAKEAPNKEDREMSLTRVGRPWCSWLQAWHVLFNAARKTIYPGVDLPLVSRSIRGDLQRKEGRIWETKSFVFSFEWGVLHLFTHCVVSCSLTLLSVQNIPSWRTCWTNQFAWSAKLSERTKLLCFISIPGVQPREGLAPFAYCFPDQIHSTKEDSIAVLVFKADRFRAREHLVRFSANFCTQPQNPNHWKQKQSLLSRRLLVGNMCTCCNALHNRAFKHPRRFCGTFCENK